MNKQTFLAAIIVGFSLLQTQAQYGPPGGTSAPPSPRLGGGMAKLFGDNSAFSASMVMRGKGTSPDESITLPGNVAFAEGKSKFAMDLTQMKGGAMPPEAAEQMKAMGMDKMTMITRPDKKTAYVVYPGMSAYVEMPVRDQESLKPPSDFKMETTELGKDTVDGHACVKTKAVVTDDKGNKHEYTVWNASGLKNFPIKIETTQEGRNVTLSFKDVKLSKPEASQFEPPPDFKSYTSMQAMMQDVMMKRMGGGMGSPPPK